MPGHHEGDKIAWRQQRRRGEGRPTGKDEADPGKERQGIDLVVIRIEGENDIEPHHGGEAQGNEQQERRSRPGLPWEIPDEEANCLKRQAGPGQAPAVSPGVIGQEGVDEEFRPGYSRVQNSREPTRVTRREQWLILAWQPSCAHHSPFARFDTRCLFDRGRERLPKSVQQSHRERKGQILRYSAGSPSRVHLPHVEGRLGVASVTGKATVTMGATIAQKVLARASGRDQVETGEIVWAAVDLALMSDTSGPRRIAAGLERLGGKPWDPEKVCVIADHFVPASDETEAAIQVVTRDWSHAKAIRKFHFFEGIMHIVSIERGYIWPGMLMVGADSHSVTAGGMGCMAVPVGSTEILGVVATGEIWLRVPETIEVRWTGRLSRGVMAKDMMLATLKRMRCDGATYKSIEYTGSGVRALPIDERLVLSNMTIELGGKAGIVAADDLVCEYLAARGVVAPTPVL